MSEHDTVIAHSQAAEEWREYFNKKRRVIAVMYYWNNHSGFVRLQLILSSGDEYWYVLDLSDDKDFRKLTDILEKIEKWPQTDYHDYRILFTRPDAVFIQHDDIDTLCQTAIHEGDSGVFDSSDIDPKE